MLNDFLQVRPLFYNVGMLREILKNYPDNTSLYIMERPGMVHILEEEQRIELEPLDMGEAYWNSSRPATGDQEYMDY